MYCYLPQLLLDELHVVWQRRSAIYVYYSNFSIGLIMY